MEAEQIWNSQFRRTLEQNMRFDVATMVEDNYKVQVVTQILQVHEDTRLLQNELQMSDNQSYEITILVLFSLLVTRL